MAITLYDVQSKQPVNFETSTEAKDALLSGAANFEPDQEVYLKDIDGNIKRSRGADAAAYVLSPGSGYDIASDNDVYLKNREARYGTPVQQGVAAVEGLVNSAGLGFGNALTKVAVGLATPGDKENKLAEQYGEAVKQRSAENPASSLTGEVAGLVIDPLGVGGLVSKGASKLGKGAAKAATVVAESPLAPKVIEKIVNNPLAKKMIERGVEFGAEGGLYGGTFEAGRQMVDSNPLNADSIMDASKSGFLTGAAIGPIFGASEQAAAKTLKVVKDQTKKYLDKITGATGDAKGEVFQSMKPSNMLREEQPALGRKQKAVKLVQEQDGSNIYKDSKMEAQINLPETAKGLDLTNPVSVEELGSKAGVKNLDEKMKYLRKAEEPLDEFIAKERHKQIIEDEVNIAAPYMEDADRQMHERIQNVKKKYSEAAETTADDIALLDRAFKEEEKLYNKYNPEYQEALPGKKADLAKKDITQARKILEDFDYVVDYGNSGLKNVFVYNENLIPREIFGKNINKGITHMDFEAGQMAKQYRMTPSKMQKMGNKRLNDVADFIFDQYPQKGSILKKATTSADYIAEQIHEVKQKAIQEINESIEQALEAGGNRMPITTEDIASYIERKILPKYADPISGNPHAGLDKAYNQIKDFAEGYRNNGYEPNRYGQKVYQPLNVKQIRDIRLKLDDIANFGKKEGSILEEEARALRTWVEDRVVSRISDVDRSLMEKYNAAKRNYGLSADAEKIVNSAAQKASKDNKFSLFYSGMGAGAGGAIAGAPGAIAGGLLGGAANNIMKEYSGNLSVFMARDLAKNAQKYETAIANTAKSFFRPAEGAVKTYIRIRKDSEGDIAKKDLERLSQEVASREKYVEDFMDRNEFLFEQYPETGERLIQTAIRARDFLVTKIPENPYIGNPWKEDTWQPSPYEVDKYMRYREAVNKPSVILDQIKNAYVTPEAAEVLALVYPETKQALMNQFLVQASKSKHIPINKRVEIFKLFGIELDTFMSGQEFAELQGQSNQQAAESQQGGPIQKPNNAYKSEPPPLTLGNSTVE